MSAYRTWEFWGRNNDGSLLTSKQIEGLISLDEYDLDAMTWDEHENFGWGHTESINAYDRIEEVLEQFAALYPEVTVKVIVQYETEPCPDGFMVKGGKVRPFSGHVVYTYDDDGAEVSLNDY